MPMFQISAIEWDTDGLKIKGLPETATVEADDDEEALDRLSDEHGWLIADCKIELVA